MTEKLEPMSDKEIEHAKEQMVITGIFNEKIPPGTHYSNALRQIQLDIRHLSVRLYDDNFASICASFTALLAVARGKYVRKEDVINEIEMIRCSEDIQDINAACNFLIDRIEALK